MNPYAYIDYRKLLRDVIEAKKNSSPHFNATLLAEKMGIQRSYLSNVLSGRADLNADQLFSAGQELGLSQDELDYVDLLLEIDRCVLKRRKDLLIERRDALRAKSQRSEEYLERKVIEVPDAAIVDYFSTPLCSLVHIMMTVEKYRKNPDLILSQLSLKKSELTEILTILERCAVVRATKKGYEVDANSRHLSQTNRLSRINAASFRLKAIEYQQRLSNSDDYFFTSTFSATVETRAFIKAQFMELLKRVGPAVEGARAEDVFQMNFDLFQLS